MLNENTYVDSGKYRGRVRLCGVMRWAAAGLLSAPRGDEEAGQPQTETQRETKMRPSLLNLLRAHRSSS